MCLVLYGNLLRFHYGQKFGVFTQQTQQTPNLLYTLFGLRMKHHHYHHSRFIGMPKNNQFLCENVNITPMLCYIENNLIFQSSCFVFYHHELNFVVCKMMIMVYV